MWSPRMGRGGYALIRKWWKKRRSTSEKTDRAGCCGDGDGGDSMVTVLGAAGYSQTRPFRLHWPHAGSVSWHLTLRLLQLKQPFRDFLWPFLGIGLRRTPTSVGCSLTMESFSDAASCCDDGCEDDDSDDEAEAEDEDEDLGGLTSTMSRVSILVKGS